MQERCLEVKIHQDLTSIPGNSNPPPSQPGVNWVESKILHMGCKLQALGRFLPISSSGKMYKRGSRIYISQGKHCFLLQQETEVILRASAKEREIK